MQGEFNFNVYELAYQKDRFDGSLDWTYQGPMIFYSVGFQRFRSMH